MKKIIINLQQFSSLTCMFSTLEQIACAWNWTKSDCKMYLKTLSDEKEHIEHAKKFQDTLKWTQSSCIKDLKEAFKMMGSYVKKNPLPDFILPYYDYAKNEIPIFVDNIKYLNSKEFTHLDKVVGSPD